MQKLSNRVPEITVYFWIIKVLATTVGETAADFLALTLGLGLSLASVIMSGVLVLVVLLQVRLQRYIPASFWSVVVLISIVGTLISDKLIDDMGVSLVTTTTLFSAILLTVFGFWYANEKTLAMHSINTNKREFFYWTAVLFTFALGTATGDLFSESLRLGYAGAALIFGAIIALITVGYYRFKLNAVLAFWLAYILTRPLGASMGDLLSQSTANGGLGYGTVGTSMLFLSMIVSLVVYLSLTKRKPALSSVDAQD